MACSTERTALALAAALAASGCLSGHLLDAARRREVPAAVRAVSLDGDDLVVTVRTTTTTDLGRSVGRGLVRARVALGDLERPQPVDQLPVRFERPQGTLPGRPLLVLPVGAPPWPRPLVRLDQGDPPALRLRTEEREYAALHLDALTRTRYAPWAWALMPAALAVDAVVVPPLLLFAPAIIAVGD